MTDKEMLDRYIEEKFSTYELDEFDKKTLSESFDFARCKLGYLSEELGNNIAKDLKIATDKAKTAFEKFNQSLKNLKK